jgi:hypothetical protein
MRCLAATKAGYKPCFIVFRMNTISATSNILTPGYPLADRRDMDAGAGSADSAKPLPRARAAVRQSPVLHLFPAFICTQALLIAALLLLNYLDSIG